MKYIIIGGGPTGLSLAYILSNNGYNVEIIEKNNQLGGSWNFQWSNDKYFSENSPRVLGFGKYTQKFLTEIGINEKEDLENIYGNMVQTSLKVFNFIKEYLSFNDYIILSSNLIKSKTIGIDDSLTLQDWFDNSDLSENAKKGLSIISITICDRPDKTNLNDFFGSMGAFNLKQLREPNKWYELLKENFSKKTNIKISTNTEVIELVEDNNKIVKAICFNKEHNKKEVKYGNKFILSTQSDGIFSILNKSNKIVQNNWTSLDWINNWCKKTYYSGFGFQLHFKEDVAFKNDWCWACKNEWTIIILPVSNWLKIKSYDNEIKTVWSCVIVDMDTKSNTIDKTVNECSIKEVIDEALNQINKLNKIPEPYKITISENLRDDDGIWKSQNTGFTRGKEEYLPIKGNIDNLFALGCFTDTGTPSISYLEKAILSVVVYLNKYEPNVNGFHNKNNYYKYIIIIFIIGFVSFGVYNKIKK